jgi:hypothetical protein
MEDPILEIHGRNPEGHLSGVSSASSLPDALQILQRASQGLFSAVASGVSLKGTLLILFIPRNFYDSLEETWTASFSIIQHGSARV